MKQKISLEVFRKTCLTFLASPLFDDILKFEKRGISITPTVLEPTYCAFDVIPQKRVKEVAGWIANVYSYWTVGSLKNRVVLAMNKNRIPTRFKIEEVDNDEWL